MNKKGFTLIELIAVVVIMGIIALIATPNIISMVDKGKKQDYISDAKEFISKATYMYKQEKYHKDEPKFNNGKIFLEDIVGLSSEDKIDPYGYVYEPKESYIIFSEPNGSLGERQVTITLKSCKEENGKETCYEIYNVNKDDLSVNSIKVVEQ